MLKRKVKRRRIQLKTDFYITYFDTKLDNVVYITNDGVKDGIKETDGYKLVFNAKKFINLDECLKYIKRNNVNNNLFIEIEERYKTELVNKYDNKGFRI